MNSPIDRYLLCLTFVVRRLRCCAKNLVRGNLGRQWMAIRDMDIAAELIGIRPLYAKLMAFAISSFIIGVAGALWAFVYLGSWEPLAFCIDRSFQILFMVIIGGLGSILRLFPRRGFHSGAADLARSGAPRARDSDLGRNRFADGLYCHRCADLLAPYRRTAWICKTLVYRQGEVETLALPLLRA